MMFSSFMLGVLLCLALSMFARACYYIDDQNVPPFLYPLAENSSAEWATYHWQEGDKTLSVQLFDGTMMSIDASQCFNHTFTYAACTAANVCRVQIPFTGSGITINVLHAGQQGINASLAIDGGVPTYNVLSPPGPNFYISNVTIFNVQGIPGDDHTATMTVLSWGNSFSGIIFDYALVNQTVVSASTAAASLSMPLDSTAFRHILVRAAGSSSSRPNVNVGLIVGVAMGGLGAVVALAAISVSYFCRRRPSVKSQSRRLTKQQKRSEHSGMYPDNASTIEPFFDPESLYNMPPQAAAVHPNASQQTTASPGVTDLVPDKRVLQPFTRSSSDPSLRAKLRLGVANPSSTSQDQLPTSITSTPQPRPSSTYDTGLSGTSTSPTGSPVASLIAGKRALQPFTHSSSDPSLRTKLQLGVANPNLTSQDQPVDTSVTSTPQPRQSSICDTGLSRTSTSPSYMQVQPTLSDGQADFVNRLHAKNVPADVIAHLIERMLAGERQSVVEGYDALAPPSYSHHVAGQKWLYPHVLRNTYPNDMQKWTWGILSLRHDCAMFDAIQRYVHKSRRGFIQSSVLLCGSYTLTTYIKARLEETKDKMLRNKLARESLRRRFQSTHDDVCYTIMALMPTLASQVLEEMNVEALTNELQSLSRASRSRTLHASQNTLPSHSVSELSSSISDVQSDAGSVTLSSYSGSALEGDRASSSWVEHMSASEGPLTRPHVPTQMSDSFTSTSSSASRNGQDSITSTSLRTKGQLWNEVKILALTRTMTTLYTITLLSLLTAVQLNLLGRSRYIDSVRTAEHAERVLDETADFSLTGILAREAVANIVDVEAIWPTWILGETEDGGKDEVSDAIPEETELRFLTLSWWVLHVGWKDVAARVRGSVESVFDDVSLKTKLSSSELFTLIMDVRRRVEMDSTGGQLGARFLSSLLPPTPETTAHVLTQAGVLSILRERENLRSSSPPAMEPPFVPPEIPYDGSGRAAAIPIESPAPHRSTFPTPPSSNAHESDLSSRASTSPSTSPVPRLRLAPTNMSDSLATSRSSLSVDPAFDTLLSETRRYLSGPDFAHTLGCALDRATEVLMDGLRTRVFVDSTSAVNVANPEEVQFKTGDLNACASGSSEKDHVTVRLAGLLPGLARWSQLALRAVPNELVDNIMAIREVNALEAIVISDYEDRFPTIS